MLCPRAPVGDLCPSDILGHLKHHIRLKRPQELRMVVCEMPFDRIQKLTIGIARELRPALTLGDPVLTFRDRCHLA